MRNNENIAILGEITAQFYDQAKLSRLDNIINRFIRKLRNQFPHLIRFYRLGKLTKIDKRKNVICNAGFNVLARLLTNDTTYTGFINKMALGTGSATPAASDTKLVTEAYRNDTASQTADANIAYLTAFFTETECNDTYTEFGNFIDGTGSADSGKIWSHIGSLNWVKSNTTVLVISCKYTFQSA